MNRLSVNSVGQNQGCVSLKVFKMVTLVTEFYSGQDRQMHDTRHMAHMEDQ